MFTINCEVSGGITGYRSSTLKSGGEITRFETIKEAEAEATRLTRQMNGPFATASFKYTAQISA